MLGPLPRLYSTLIVVSLLAIGTGLGVWFGLLDSVPVVVTTGVAIGAGLAAVSAWLLLHDFHRRASSTPVRTRRRG